MAALILTIVASWGIYALLGIGIVLIYRTSRVLNIAGGELAIFIGYVAATAIQNGFRFPAAVRARYGGRSRARACDLLVCNQARDGRAAACRPDADSRNCHHPERGNDRHIRRRDDRNTNRTSGIYYTAAGLRLPTPEIAAAVGAWLAILRDCGDLPAHESWTADARRG